VKNQIKNPAEHHKDEATGPEQRRGLNVSQAIGDDKYQAIAFHCYCGLTAARRHSSRPTAVPVMMIPVSNAVSIVLRQIPLGNFAMNF
jgi:hypothetical protein